MYKGQRFVDERGSVWYVDSLKKAAANLPTFNYEVNFESLLDEPINWILKNFRDYAVHFKRVTEANLDEPIILRSDGFIMDGWHRLIKAYFLGIKVLPAKQFVVDPPPDEEN